MLGSLQRRHRNLLGELLFSKKLLIAKNNKLLPAKLSVYCIKWTIYYNKLQQINDVLIYEQRGIIVWEIPPYSCGGVAARMMDFMNLQFSTTQYSSLGILYILYNSTLGIL